MLGYFGYYLGTLNTSSLYKTYKPFYLRHPNFNVRYCPLFLEKDKKRQLSLTYLRFIKKKIKFFKKQSYYLHGDNNKVRLEFLQHKISNLFFKGSFFSSLFRSRFRFQSRESFRRKVFTSFKFRSFNLISKNLNLQASNFIFYKFKFRRLIYESSTNFNNTSSDSFTSYFISKPKETKKVAISKFFRNFRFQDNTYPSIYSFHNYQFFNFFQVAHLKKFCKKVLKSGFFFKIFNFFFIKISLFLRSLNFFSFFIFFRSLNFYFPIKLKFPFKFTDSFFFKSKLASSSFFFSLLFSNYFPKYLSLDQFFFKVLDLFCNRNLIYDLRFSFIREVLKYWLSFRRKKKKEKWLFLRLFLEESSNKISSKKKDNNNNIYV